MISTFLVLSLAFTGCRSGAGEDPPGEIQGWEKTSHSARHTAADLHKHLNGGAAKYLAYSIQELRVQEYRRLSDGFTATVELYRMDSPDNAYGVYSCDRGGEHPEGLGEEASYEGGLLQFCRGAHYVRVQAVDPAREPGPAVLELGMAVSGGLPPAGSPPPGLVQHIPRQGMLDDSLCYFHNQVTLNSIYYLSDENLLGLGADTDAVTAEYRTKSGGIARVIAVCYPDAKEADKALRAFETAYGDEGADSDASKPACTFASVRGRFLVAVLEAPSDVEARALARLVLETPACAEGEREEESK